jgi:hypothetical protein
LITKQPCDGSKIVLKVGSQVSGVVETASGFSPSFGGPCFAHILLGGGLGSPKFPSGVPKPAAPRAELAVCSDRTKSKEQRGRPALVVNNYVPDAAPTILLLQLLLNHNCCSLLLCGGREQARACISLRSAQRLFRVDQRESPSLLNTLSISLNRFRDIELCFLTKFKSSSFWSSSLSPTICPREAHRGVPGPLRTVLFSYRDIAPLVVHV